MVARAVRSPLGIDWMPSAVVAPLLLLFAALSGHRVSVLVVLAAFAGTLPLGVRRQVAFRWLWIPFVAGIVLEVGVVHPGSWVILVPVVMLFDLSRFGTRRRSLWMASIVLPSVAVSVVPFVSGSTELARALIQSVLLCLLAIAAGDGLRTRRLAVERGAAERQALALQQAANQRLQIAQEIHDTVAHAMTAINVQAGVAAHLIDRDPGLAREALRAIKDASGDALRELREVLGILREPEGEAPRAPTATLANLTPLTAGLHAAGLKVAINSDPVDDVAANIQAAGYRIIQEATTNIIRHAHAASVQITLARDSDNLLINVIDDGMGTAVTAGNGIRGMSERAAAMGGELSTAPATPHGWQVQARLPLQPSEGP